VSPSMPLLILQLPPKGDIFIEFKRGHSHGVATIHNRGLTKQLVSPIIASSSDAANCRRTLCSNMKKLFVHALRVLAERQASFILAAVLLAAALSRLSLLAADSAGAVSLDDDPHLVGWWKFDETTGKTATDSSRHAHQGTLEGALSFDTNSVPGRIGKALQFLGGSDGVRIAGYKGITGTQARSVAVWIKTTASSGDLVSWGTNEHGEMWTFGHVRGRIGVTPKGGYLYMKAGTRDEAWHHVAVTVAAAAPPNLHDHVKLYRDGEVAEIDDIGLLDLWPIETGDSLDVSIGRGFKGILDDLRLYDRALSEDEIKALFKQQSDRP